MSDQMLRMPQGGPDYKTPDGVRQNVVRIGQQNDAIVSQMHGKMYEQALRKNMFFAANQAAVTTGVALTTTHLGFCLSNPVGNSKNLIPRQFGFSLSVSPAALSTLGLQVGYAVGGVTAHTTPLVAYSTVIGSGQAATAKVDAAATLVGTPYQIMPLAQLDDDGAIGFGTPTAIDLEGSIILPPGAYIAIYTLTVVIGMFGMTWEEVPR